MWHLMSLTISFVVCLLSAINCVAAAPIDSANEAARYLERFGYLEREPQDSSYSESVKAESFTQLFDAIKDFQSFAGLKKTGELDKETLELMNKPRCGVADRIRPGHSSTRRKRFAIQGSHWPKKQLTYKIKKYTTDMPKSDVDREIARAFQMWADVTDLTFVHVNNPSADVDIDILFAIGEHDDGEHGSCPSFNDGPGDTLAHAAHPINGGDAHFDDGETWTLDSVKGTNLFQVATHEFGHSLGLEHTNLYKAVMYFAYEYRSDFKLDKDDIEGIQELYGKNQFSRKLALELKATLEVLKTTVNNLEKKNIELKNDLIDTRTNLNKKLEATTELLITTANNLEKTNTELKNAKSDFTNRLKECTSGKQELEKTRTNFNNRSTKLNETKQELVKMRADSTVTVDDLSAKLNATTELLTTTVNNLVKTNTELRNVQSELSNTRIVLTDELQGNKQDLEKTKANFNNLATKFNETKQELVITRTNLLSFLVKTVDDLSAKLNATDKKLAETKIATGILSTELKNCVANSDQIGKELRIAEENLKKDLRATLTDMETTKRTLASTRTELNSTKSAVADLTTKLNNRNNDETFDIGKMPTSCADLQRMGQKVNGFFLVKGSKKMEMIYCDFFANQNDKQKWIGYADVKSAPVHFYVQRNSSFKTEHTPIPFELAVVNEGNAMDLTSGIFTAPRPGIYFFSFAGVAHLYSSSYLAFFYFRLYLNGNLIGSSYVYENKYPVYQWNPLTLQSTLNLKKGDQVWVSISYSMFSFSSLVDTSFHLTHFTGFMLEEEIAASL